ncbi:hypothetical protein IKE_05952 [Bacillus cereus VD196]|uniref:Uncharacterized protein n=1 Tax=Bacillus cereus VD196 TaxID=1053243 RepID=A0A9W5V601_BACCE|nr:hypothetical protein [Bacillus cereus]EJR90569.1 hypothetical protein IKG_05951 [Bacillus cereus VD200]EOO60752.1 hypothetical protein IKE_05952 [Bacillus cereus VD196]
MPSKKRDSFFWNLKKIENEEFFNWFESQSNIADSLYKLVCYFIDKHGLQDVTDYKVQQQMQKEILLQDKAFLNDIKQLLLNDTNFITPKENIKIENNLTNPKKVINSFEKSSYNKAIQKEGDFKCENQNLKEDYDDLDTATLFGN